MSEEKNWYLVCYDVRCPKRWRKAVTILEAYGERVQYSIFRCWLTLRLREKLRWQLKKVLLPEDRLLLIRLSEQCVANIQKYNDPSAWPPTTPGFEIIE